LAIILLDPAKIASQLPTDAELRKDYAAKQDTFRTPERVQARHILIKSDTSNDAALCTATAGTEGPCKATTKIAASSASAAITRFHILRQLYVQPCGRIEWYCDSGGGLRVNNARRGIGLRTAHSRLRVIRAILPDRRFGSELLCGAGLHA